MGSENCIFKNVPSGSYFSAGVHNKWGIKITFKKIILVVLYEVSLCNLAFLELNHTTTEKH